MILVTQGYEKGIGVEVFLKSILCLTQKDRQNFSFFCEESFFFEQCRTIKISPEFFFNSGLDIHLFKKRFFSTPTTQSLNLALECIKSPKDILLTLPTTKSELIFKGHIRPQGYTEFLRRRFKNPELAMVFKANDHYLMLLTDHLPLSKVPKIINSRLAFSKTKLALNEISKHFSPIKNVTFSGINPHAGEDGVFGEDYKIFSQAIKKLHLIYKSKIDFSGPLSGDTLYYHSPSAHSLYIFSHHDQGLGPFKSKYGFKGLNLTLGLPFLRISPDFGTASQLFNKNCVSYYSFLGSLNNLLRNTVYGKSIY